ncbi:MAG TPA: hypothetical protein VF524_07040, partial [Polyangia bacterium]
MRRTLACLVPLCLWFAVGCSPVVEAEFSDINVTRPDIAVPGAGTSGLSSVMFSFSFDSTGLGANSNLEAQSGLASVKLHKLDLTAKGGVVDLSFIQTLHAFAFVPMAKTNSQSTRQVEIADYERHGNAPAGATFSVPLPEPVDIRPLLQPSSADQRKIVV